MANERFESVFESEPGRLLLIRPSALGDVCRTVPALVSLKRRFPGTEIDWLVQDSFAEAIASHPDLARVVPFERKRVAVGRWWRRDARRTLAEFLGDLRRAGYDGVFDLQGLVRSGIFALTTGARVRVGFANAGELGWVGLNRRYKVPREIHTVDRMLRLVELSGVPVERDMRLYTNKADRESVDSRLQGVRYTVVAPTSRWPGKRWPADRFARVIAAILSDGGMDAVALVGGPGEREQCGELVALAKREPRVVDLIGRTRVGELMAIIEGSTLVLANDSAAVHMAVGFDRPLVGLYGPTRIDLVGPYGRERDVLTPGVAQGGNRHKDEIHGRAMMERITTEQVIAAVLARCATPFDSTVGGSPPPPRVGETRVALRGKCLVLASTSKRRRQLLIEHGFEHEGIAPLLDDAQLRHGAGSAEEWVSALAYLKARSVADALRAGGRSNVVVLGGDTVVVKDGEIIGQPRDEEDAERILSRLSGGEHRVLTGVALVHDGRRDVFVEGARVRVGNLGSQRIRAYVEGDGWRGKAGAYNLLERLAEGWPIEYEGDPTCIVGLPMQRLSPVLRSILVSEEARATGGK